MKKILYLFLLVFFVSCGNKSNSDSSSNSLTSENESNSAKYADIAMEGYNTGFDDGVNDGWNNDYKLSYTLSCNYSSENEKSNYINGYRKGYDDGFKAGRDAHNEELAKQIEEYENGEVFVTDQSNYYSEEYSEKSIYSNYSNYEETDDCEEGVVVYEGDDDYYIVETRKGYTVLETYSGILYEGDNVRGELNEYNFRYIINRDRNSEVKVYIEDYMLSAESALEWLGEHDHLADDDQRAYDANNY